MIKQLISSNKVELGAAAGWCVLITLLNFSSMNVAMGIITVFVAAAISFANYVSGYQKGADYVVNATQREYAKAVQMQEMSSAPSENQQPISFIDTNLMGEGE